MKKQTAKPSKLEKERFTLIMEQKLYCQNLERMAKLRRKSNPKLACDLEMIAKIQREVLQTFIQKIKDRTPKQKRNEKILESLKQLHYTKKEKVYAPLIIEVMEAANSFGKELENCVVEHNIIEQVLYIENLSFISDEFGRRQDEMGEWFINACEKLNEAFNKNNPDASDFVSSETTWKYLTKEYNRERNFMQKLIWKIVEPLNLKSINQQIFVDGDFFDVNNKKELTLTWTSGTRGGNYICNYPYYLNRKVTKKEVTMITKAIEEYLKKHNTGVLEYNEVEAIIEPILA